MGKKTKTLPLTPTFLPLINERIQESSQKAMKTSATIPMGEGRMTMSANDGNGIDYTQAQTWWISEDMCTLVAASDSDESAREAVQELNITTRMPQTGIMYFEEPIIFSDGHDTNGYKVAAIAWQIRQNGTLQDIAVQIFAPKQCAYSFTGGMDTSVPIGILIPQYQQQQAIVKELEAGKLEPRMALMQIQATTRQVTMFRRAAFRLATITFALMEQEHVADTKEDDQNPELLPTSVRKAMRRNQTKVRLAYVRNHTDEERPTTGRKNKPYEYRFIVSGHWRNQAYGKEHKQRRRTWIAPFIKGPADKPIHTDKRPIVHIFDGK